MPKPGKAKLSLTRKIILFCGCFILLVLLGTGAYAGFLYMKTERALDKISVAKPAPTPVQTVDKPVEISAPRQKPLSILLLGIDYRKQTGSMNSDVIMAVTMNPETKSATIVSIPRDLQLHPEEEGLEARKVNYYYPHFYIVDKPNVFERTKKVFEPLFGLHFDYVVTFNFEGFKDVVDALDGLTLTVDQDMRYVDNSDGTNINLKKGMQLLNGKQTLDFVRYRKSNMGTAGTEETDRNRRQQQVLGQIVDKLKSFTGVTKLHKVIDAVGENVRTDMPVDEMETIFKTYFGLSNEDIQFIHLEGDWESPYVVVKDEDLEVARKALQDNMNGTDAVAEKMDHGLLQSETQNSNNDLSSTPDN